MSETKLQLFENGNVWQWSQDGKTELDPPRANWFTVVDNRFQDIGFGSPPEDIRRISNEIVNLNGKLVLPGLHDSHIHIYSIGLTSEYLDLANCTSMDELKDRLKKHANAFPNSNWIVGSGFEQDKLNAGGKYPTRFDLDEIVSDRPVLLWRACWHIALANTKAMEFAGMDLQKTDWDIPGGVVDVENHSPTGILRELATRLVAKYVVERSDGVRKKHIQYGLQQCVQFGLTAVHTNDHDSWRLYQELQNEGKLPIRVYLTPDHREIGNGRIPPPGTKDGLLSCDRVKLFSDGSLGAETAALRNPYRGTENKGVLIHTDADMLRLITKAEMSGYRLEIHAIGDRAAAQVLNALSSAEVKPERRPILTHCQVLGPDLIKQMSDLGVIGNIQPSFVITDAHYVQKRLEKSTIPFSYCWKRMIDSKVVCAGGSDAPIEICNPFQGIYDAIFRCKPGDENSCFLKDERLNFIEALEIYTKNGAFAAMEEHQLGQIRQNFKADFVVLNEDVSEDHSKLLGLNLVESVWVDGIKRYTGDGKQIRNSGPNFSASGLDGKNGQIKICFCCEV